MLVSLALVAPGLLFLNYAIEKCSILCPNFQAQFWTQCNCFFSILWPHFQAQFWTQFWGSALTPPYLFFFTKSQTRPQNWTPKLDPKMGPKLPLKIWPQIACFPENLATNWIFFQLRPSRNKGCQAHQSKKSQHPTQHGILLILWNGWKDCWSISLQVIEKKHWEGKWGNVNPECSATGEAPPCVCKNPLYFDTVFWGLGFGQCERLLIPSKLNFTALMVDILTNNFRNPRLLPQNGATQ